jgi:hypothetical protein
LRIVSDIMSSSTSSSTHTSSAAASPETLRDYLAYHYPSQAKQLDLLFDTQEALRCRDAAEWGPRSSTGWPGWEAIVKELDSGAFAKDRALEKALMLRRKDIDEKKPVNVRAHVKLAWTWPLSEYIGWALIDCSISSAVTSIANLLLATQITTLKLVDGKIYMMLNGFCDRLWKAAAESGIDLGNLIPHTPASLIPNTESEHLTLVNSDVLAPALAYPHGTEELDKKLELLSVKSLSMPVLRATGLRHTLSLDWSPFGVCLVLGLECKCGALEGMWSFLRSRGVMACAPSLHITLAILPRSRTVSSDRGPMSVGSSESKAHAPAHAPESGPGLVPMHASRPASTVTESKTPLGTAPTYYTGSYPAKHFSLDNGATRPEWWVTTLKIKPVGGIGSESHMMVKLNPSDARGYRALVVLVTPSAVDMPGTLNRPYSLGEKQALYRALALVAHVYESLGLVAQTEVAGNNAHSWTDGKLVLGTPSEPIMLHGHVLGRGDPGRAYVPGLPDFHLGGPPPGRLFNMRGDGSDAGNTRKEKWPLGAMPVLATHLRRLLWAVCAKSIELGVDMDAAVL